MGKRAAAKTSPSKTSPAKKAAKIEAAPVDPFVEECAPVRALIERHPGLNDPCREMLKAMSPHCLVTATDERHAFQVKMVDVLDQLRKEVEENNSAAITAAQAEVAEVQADEDKASQKVEEAQKNATTKREERDAKAGALEQADGEARTAKATLVAEQGRQKQLADARETAADEETKFSQLLSEKWEPCKSGSFAKQAWRDRNKAVNSVLEVLSRFNISESLLGALPIALKTKAEDRTPFVEKAIEFGEAALTEHAKTLKEKLASLSADIETCSSNLVTFEAALKESQEKQIATQESFCTAENELLMAEASLNEVRLEVEALEPRRAEAAGVLAAAREDFEGVQALAKQLEALKARSRPAEDAGGNVAAANETVAGEAAPMVTAE